MIKTVFEKVMFVGRAATFVVGLAVVVALTAGLASTALAGTGVGARFDLGKVNTVNAITKLVGSVAGPSLQIDNGSADASATALDLHVEPGKAPMSVNSDTRVTNLNADELDGKGAGEIGVNGLDRGSAVSPSNSQSSKVVTAFCTEGKNLVGTGYEITGAVKGSFPNMDADVVVQEVEPFLNATRVTAYEEEPTGANWSVTAYAMCATAP